MNWRLSTLTILNEASILILRHRAKANGVIRMCLVFAIFINLAGCTLATFVRKPYRKADGRWMAEGLADGLPTSTRWDRDLKIDYSSIYVGSIPYIQSANEVYYRFWPSGQYLSKAVPKCTVFSADQVDVFTDAVIGQWAVKNDTVYLQHLVLGEPKSGQLSRESGKLLPDRSGFIVAFPAKIQSSNNATTPVITYARRSIVGMKAQPDW